MDNINEKNYREVSLAILIHNHKHKIRLYESIEYFFSKLQLDQTIKKTSTFLIQGTIRELSSLDIVLEDLIKKYHKSIPVEIKFILRLGYFQIKNMSAPNYAIVSSYVNISKNYNIKFHKLVNAVLRKTINYKKTYNNPNSVIRAKLLNHPNWLYNKWINDNCKEYAEKMALWNNTIPLTWFRVNNLTYNKKSFISYLESNKISFNQYKYNDIYFTTKQSYSLINCKLFKEGKITVQNPFSGFVCKLVNPQENDIIIDACASPGGKTSYLAELMHNKSTLYAHDLNNKRLKLLNDTLFRMKLSNINVSKKEVSFDKLNFANKILLDVPCSGTGVLNKYPDIKWRKNKLDINEMVEIQKKILINTSKFLKKGGSIVYSTCSVEKEENDSVIKWFLNKNSNFHIKNITNIIPDRFINNNGFFSTIPYQDNIDGGFAAVLTRNA